ncbi:hypothetical protein RFI_21627, partial [Reticulomyxa filosa]
KIYSRIISSFFRNETLKFKKKQRKEKPKKKDTVVKLVNNNNKDSNEITLLSFGGKRNTHCLCVRNSLKMEAEEEKKNELNKTVKTQKNKQQTQKALTLTDKIISPNFTKPNHLQEYRYVKFENSDTIKSHRETVCTSISLKKRKKEIIMLVNTFFAIFKCLSIPKPSKTTETNNYNGLIEFFLFQFSLVDQIVLIQTFSFFLLFKKAELYKLLEIFCLNNI